VSKIEIDIQPAVDAAKREATSNLARQARDSALGVVRTLFADGSRYQQPEGLAHELIRKKIEEFILSDKFSDQLDVIIEGVMKEEMTNAVRTLLASKTRKHLFTATDS
jgi:hypothetical protein